MPRIVYVPFGGFDRQFAQKLAPAGFELVEVSAGSAELHAAMPEADYLIGLGDRSMDDAFYAPRQKLKLVQLLSAGYDRYDIEAARRAARADLQQRRRQLDRGRRARADADARGLPPADLAAPERRRAGAGAATTGRTSTLRAGRTRRSASSASATSARRSRASAKAFDMDVHLLRHHPPERRRRKTRSASASACCRRAVCRLRHRHAARAARRCRRTT